MASWGRRRCLKTCIGVTISKVPGGLNKALKCLTCQGFTHIFIYKIIYSGIYSYYIHVLVFCILPRRIISLASWLCQVERVSAKLKVTMPNDSKEWRSVVSRVALWRLGSGGSGEAQAEGHRTNFLVTKVHIGTCGQDTPAANKTVQAGGGMLWRSLEFLLFLIHMIFQRSFCLQPSSRQVIESQFPASKVLMGVMGSVVWTFLEWKELSNF